MKFLKNRKLEIWISPIFFILIFCVLVATAKSQNNIQLAITDSLRSKYWRAQYDLKVAETAANVARAKWVEVMKDVSAACGQPNTVEIYLNGEGEPYCKVSQ